MKIQINEATVNNGIIKIKGIDYKTKENILIEINSKDPNNYIYLRDKLKKYPWTHSCKTWGNVLKGMKNRIIEISKKYIAA